MNDDQLNRLVAAILTSSMVMRANVAEPALVVRTYFTVHEAILKIQEEKRD
jgi:hypothetical protein